jgi:hypothetical protein
MPKAAVNKQRHAAFDEREVWPSKNRKMPTPSGDSISAENSRHSKLRGRVSTPTHLGHQFRTLSF